MIEELLRYRRRVDVFVEEAHRILEGQESARSRIPSLDRTRKRIVGLSLQQDELLEQSLLCVDKGVYRAAHVMAWAAFMDLLEQKLASDNLAKVHAAKPGWAKHSTLEELRENIPEFQLIEVARDINLLRKPEMKSIHGLLSKRNECAHPSSYKPGWNDTLGYVAELLNRIEALIPRTL